MRFFFFFYILRVFLGLDWLALRKKKNTNPSSIILPFLYFFTGNAGCVLLVITCTSNWHGWGFWEIRLICLRASGWRIHSGCSVCLLCWLGHALAGKMWKLLHGQCKKVFALVCGCSRCAFIWHYIIYKLGWLPWVTVRCDIIAIF